MKATVKKVSCEFCGKDAYAYITNRYGIYAVCVDCADPCPAEGSFVPFELLQRLNKKHYGK